MSELLIMLSSSTILKEKLNIKNNGTSNVGYYIQQKCECSPFIYKK